MRIIGLFCLVIGAAIFYHLFGGLAAALYVIGMFIVVLALWFLARGMDRRWER